MRTVGIIAEYNPFHTGHEYHIQKAKEAADADYAVIVMSPDFVQRGEPALFDKYTRTEMALRCGADLVLELPVCYATGSAEYFAQGAVTLLNSLGVVNTLCFGGESDQKELFQNTARVLHQEPEKYVQLLRDQLKNGKTYPQARSKALEGYFPSDTFSKKCILSDFLSTPNNILGIEYCKALQKISSSITPLPIQRRGSDYNSSDLNGPYCSATALRKAVAESTACPHDILDYIPKGCQKLFTGAALCFLTAENLLPYLNQKLLTIDNFEGILDISPDLSDRIRSFRYKCIGKSYKEIVSSLKTKQITEARIRRALLHLILDIHSETVEDFRQKGTIYYARMLGFRKSAAPLLHELKHRTEIPVISKTAAGEKILSGEGKKMWKQDFCGSHLYRSILASTYGISFKTEYEYSPVIL